MLSEAPVRPPKTFEARSGVICQAGFLRGLEGATEAYPRPIHVAAKWMPLAVMFLASPDVLFWKARIST